MGWGFEEWHLFVSPLIGSATLDFACSPSTRAARSLRALGKQLEIAGAQDELRPDLRAGERVMDLEEGFVADCSGLEVEELEQLLGIMDKVRWRAPER